MKKITILKISLTILIVLILGIVFFVFKNRNTTPATDALSDSCQQSNLPYLDSNLSITDRVNDLISRMNNWEKIGQMVLIEKNSINNLNDITWYNLGALLSGGGAGPEEDTPLAWLQMLNNFQDKANDTCLGIPLLYGIDAVHG